MKYIIYFAENEGKNWRFFKSLDLVHFYLSFGHGFCSCWWRKTAPVVVVAAAVAGSTVAVAAARRCCSQCWSGPLPPAAAAAADTLLRTCFCIAYLGFFPFLLSGKTCWSRAVRQSLSLRAAAAECYSPGTFKEKGGGGLSNGSFIPSTANGGASRRLEGRGWLSVAMVARRRGGEERGGGEKDL